jgi:hypothetical protein
LPEKKTDNIQENVGDTNTIPPEYKPKDVGLYLKLACFVAVSSGDVRGELPGTGGKFLN